MKSNEWYTPAKYIEAAREVMGSIDLDPASTEMANMTIRATRIYTEEDNGLILPWHGRIWCNPPYTQIKKGHSSIAAWVDKMLGEPIEQGILLIPNDTSTRWFSRLWQYPICFPPKRIKFYIVGETRFEQPTFGVCFVYRGYYEQKFIDVFSRYGPVVRCISPQKIQLELFCERETLSLESLASLDR